MGARHDDDGAPHERGRDGHDDTPQTTCHKCKRARQRLYRERNRDFGGTSARTDMERKRAAQARTVDVLALGGRTVVRIGRHTFGGVERFNVDDVLAAAGVTFPIVSVRDVLIARVPRAESVRNRAVTRGDGGWNTRNSATPARACRHKRGHVARHSHGSPDVPRWLRRTIDALACTTFGHDPARAALDRSTMGEVFAAFTPGYRMVESFTVRAERIMRERREHVEGTWAWEADERGRAVRVRVTDACADCRNAERNTSWTQAVPAARAFAPMPDSAATRRANARLSVTRTRTRAEIERDTAARTADVAALDARTWAREYRGVVA